MTFARRTASAELGRRGLLLLAIQLCLVDCGGLAASEAEAKGGAQSGGAARSWESANSGGFTNGGAATQATVSTPSTGGASRGGAPSTDGCKACTEDGVLVGDLRATTQNDLNEYTGVKRVTGSIILEGDESLQSLEPLALLETIEGDLVLAWMYNLGSVDGLSALRTIGGKLSITHSNIAKVNLDALGSVEHIGGDYEVSDCNGDLLLERIGREKIGGTVLAAGSSDC